jgi:hypothetical protein
MQCFCKKEPKPQEEEKTSTLKLNDVYRRVSSDLRMSVLQNTQTHEAISSVKTKSKEVSFKEFSLNYIKFREFVDLSSEKRTIVNFDLSVFSFILNNSYFDEFIFNFLIKLTNDPLIYDKQGREDFFIILLMSYFYSLKENCMTKEIQLDLRKKISENIHYLNKNKKVKFNFYILRTKEKKSNITAKVKINNHKIVTTIDNNFIINNIIINLYKFTDWHDEALFLNYFYKNLTNKMNKELFLDFKKRLYDDIRQIEKSGWLIF